MHVMESAWQTAHVPAQDDNLDKGGAVEITPEPLLRTPQLIDLQSQSPNVTQITPGGAIYHCGFRLEADNEERYYPRVVPTEVGL